MIRSQIKFSYKTEQTVYLLRVRVKQKKKNLNEQTDFYFLT